MKRVITSLLAILFVLPMVFPLAACTTETGGENMANYLTFSSENSFTISVKDAYKYWNGTLEYSTDGSSWAEWGGETSISSGEHDGKQCIYMRGIGNSKITGSAGRPYWVLTGTEIRCTGNIETLLDYETVADGGHPAMAAYCYNSMFQGCTSLVTAPSLPATTLAENCYYYMFYGCSSLVEAPALPATTLAENCYSGMFRGCSSLVAAPALPATTLADHCYDAMFYGCSSLTVAPMLPATTLTEYCYCNMFRGCTGLAFATAQSADYPYEYRIPTNGEGTEAKNALLNMFTETGGTFTGTPEINTTLFAASGGSKLTISTGGSANGDGMALYNGVMLPNIDSVWDKTKYPYAFISQFPGADYGDADAFVCSLYLVSAPGVFTDDGVKYTESFSCAEWLFTDSQTIIDMLISAGLSDAVVGKWLFGGDRDVEVSSPHSELFQEPFWSSYDIFDVSGGTQLATSAPIPLDGMNVITWDGNTDGLEAASPNIGWYRVSSETPTASQLDGGSIPSIVALSNGEFAPIGTGYVEPSEFGNGWAIQGITFVAFEAGETNGLTIPSAGTYFMRQSDDAYISLLAYPATSGGVTETTATVNFSCKDLLYTDSVYRIKAWVYKVADGLDVTLAPTWTSELFAGPSHSESHTFTGLTPATEYGIYAVIWSETDGAATEHNATATFTTLEGEAPTGTIQFGAVNITGTGFTAVIEASGLDDATAYTAEIVVYNTATSAVAAEAVRSFTGNYTMVIDFAGLTPETDYTVAVDVYPTDTGKVVARGEFPVATGQEEPKTSWRDSFLLGFASGLGCTAATKTDADHNAWMQGYIVGDELRKALYEKKE